MNILGALVLATLAAAADAQAQMSPDMKMPPPMKAASPVIGAPTVMTGAVVQKVEAAQARVTLKHENITNVGMSWRS